MIKGKFLTFDDDLSQLIQVRNTIFKEELNLSDASINANNDSIAIHAIVINENDKILSIGRGVFGGLNCTIDLIGTIQNERNKGYGDFIVRMLCDRAFSCGAKTVTALSFANSERFFSNIGFIKSSNREVGICQYTINRDDFIYPCKKCNNN